MTACNVKLDAAGDGGQTKVGLLEAVLGNGGLGLKIAKKGGCRSNSRSSLEILLHVADELVGHPRVLHKFSIMKSLEYRSINNVREVGEPNEDQGVSSRVIKIKNNEAAREGHKVADSRDHICDNILATTNESTALDGGSFVFWLIQKVASRIIAGKADIFRVVMILN